ncbi:fatty acyl-AMP ligase [Nocardia puris]|uniref:Acyl-CoA synthetase (AMP-forming)/AMP-acid ligase II n=1 Tax=Nocardia puris TaxID=208602 RepID=A0A366E329_9NOCA|nr:fatty acyl-AMP ligase [Nocardia puris]RBO96781.1 acyl-CoA synthetase (AMP-forming)/AMP-acid ligase II [Nocardia puris]
MSAEHPLPAAPPEDHPHDLVAAVRHWSRHRPQAPALTHLTHRGRSRDDTVVTYQELDRDAAAVADWIARHTRQDDRVAIMCPHGPDYVRAFLGCLYAGRIAVPLHAPGEARDRHRVTAVLEDCAPALIFAAAPEPVAAFGAGPVAVVESILTTAPTTAVPPDDDNPDRIAYLQYTSGSTRAPAGVVVTRANLAANLRQLRDALPVVRSRPVVTWLPMFHDMGLVFAVALPLSAGGHSVFMAPGEFVQRPARWLRAISDFGGGVSASPDFGLATAAADISAVEREDLDLSTLTALVNGAEPIRAGTLAAFTRAYAPHGFRPESHSPGYGLAEATLGVSLTPQGRGPVVGHFDRRALEAGRAVPGPARDDRTAPVVGCGVALDQDVAVVDPLTRNAMAPDTVGEVWVRGPNVGRGYFGRADDTADVFGARVEPGDGTGGWLRTGDLGFLSGGELYLVGRLKDLIIARGRNHYPADIESTAAAAAPEIRPGHVAAFSIAHEDGERLIVVAEVDRRYAHSAFDAAEAARRIRGAVAKVHDVVPHEVMLVQAGQLPKTTSGKLQRKATRVKYANHRLAEFGCGTETTSPRPALGAATEGAP